MTEQITKAQREQGMTEQASLEQKWERILEAEGLGVAKHGPEHLEFEIVAEEEAVPGPEACPIPTENDYRILDRIRRCGFAATPEEANATMGAIRRLADAGFANIRYHNGRKFLALAGATDGDVARAAARHQAELDDANVARVQISAAKVARRILSRLRNLGGAADTNQLFATLRADLTASEITSGLQKLSGKVRRVKTPHGFDLMFLADVGIEAAVEAAKRLQRISKQVSRHHNLSGKKFLSGASGDRPYNEPNPNTEEAAKDAAGDEFRAAYRKARKQEERREALRAAGRLPQELPHQPPHQPPHQTKPDTEETAEAKASGTVPEYLEAKISSRKRRKAIIRTMVGNARKTDLTVKIAA